MYGRPDWEIVFWLVALLAATITVGVLLFR